MRHDSYDEWLVAGIPLEVYVMAHPAQWSIRPGSGIVGSPDGPVVMIDYEGNVYGAENLRRYVERVHHAAGRHVVGYPTRARAWVPATELVSVGSWDGKELRVRNVVALQVWLGRAPDPGGRHLRPSDLRL